MDEVGGIGEWNGLALASGWAWQDGKTDWQTELGGRANEWIGRIIREGGAFWDGKARAREASIDSQRDIRYRLGL